MPKGKKKVAMVETNIDWSKLVAEITEAGQLIQDNISMLRDGRVELREVSPILRNTAEVSNNIADIIDMFVPPE